MSVAAAGFRPGYARKALVWGLCNSLVSAATVAVALPIIVRIVGLGDYGHWAILALFVSVGGAADLGLARSMVINMTLEPATDPRRFLSAGLIVALGIAGVVSGAIIAAHSAGSALWGKMSFVNDTDGSFLLIAGSSVVFLYMATTAMRGALEGVFAVHWVSIGWGLQTFLYYTLALVAAALWADWYGMILASLAAYLLIAVLHWCQLRKRYGPLLVWPGVATLRAIFREGVFTSSALLPAAATLPLLGYMFVRQATSAAQYGAYDLSLKITILIATAVTVAGLPMLSIASSTRAAPAQTRPMALKLAGLGMLAYAGAVTVLWLAGPPILRMIVPQAGPEVASAALTALCGAGLLAAIDPLNRTLLGLGRLRGTFLSRLGMLTATLLAVWLIEAPPLQRFTTSYAIGCGTCALLIFIFFMYATRRSA